ncbi:MAG: alpha/beta fold hydrolase [Burkholderiales bacterium]
MLPGFEARRVAAAGVGFSVHTAGTGPAVLLLHGYPQTHLIWRHLAPGLARRFGIVAPDLKGYGDSDAPQPAPDSSNYSKRALAAELVALMGAVGHERFSVVGHDRGARVAYRMALDHPARVARLVVLDIVPTGAMWAGATRVFAVNTFHWGFLAQGAGMPERLIGADPDCWLEFVCRKWARDFAKLADAMPEYARAFRKPEVIAATCADYRAGATRDDEHDRADLAAGRKIACPTLAIWSNTFVGKGKSADPLETWREYAVDVRGFPVGSGHFIPEEAPEAIGEPVERFLAD